MHEHAWVIKDGVGLEAGLQRMKQVASAIDTGPATDATRSNGFTWSSALEVPSLLSTAELMLTGAIQRKESRGAFFRADYPDTDNENFLTNFVYKNIDGKTVLDAVPVDLKYCRPDRSMAGTIL